MKQLSKLLLEPGTRRELHGKLKLFVNSFAAIIAIATIITTTMVYIDLYMMTVVFLATVMVLLFLMYTAGPAGRQDKPSPLDWILACTSLGVGIYFFVESGRIVERITLLFPLEMPDLIAASLLLGLTIEATRRTVGPGLTTIVLAFMLYNLYGYDLPSGFGFRQVSYNHFLDIIIFTTDGLFGVPIRVAATYAFLFVMFGTFLARAGGADFFYNIASAIAGNKAGGPAKISVISSGLYGTMSGSPTSDVVTTGSITIPIMQRLGYSKSLSGSVEVAASTGGSLLPPVMGSAAFIMAEYTGIDYGQIVIAGIIPALLYYLCVYTQVHLRSQKLGLKGLPRDETPKLISTLKDGGLFLLPLVALCIALVLGYSPTYVAAIATGSVVIVAGIKRNTRMGPRAIWDALAETSLRIVPVVAACAAAGLVIGGISMTGLGNKFATLVFSLAGDSTILVLMISAVLAIILGMGMPTPSAYILAAVLVAPTLTELDFSLLQSNMFILYFAVLSAMTPPVAVAAFAAAAIANTSPLSIAIGAVRLAITAFIIPFAFIYGDGLLLAGSWFDNLVACLTATIGVILLSIGIEGFLKANIQKLPRFGFVLAGLLFIFPNMQAIIFALVLTIISIILSPNLRKALKNN